METIRTTTPHYIRCIKSNMQQKAFQFDPKLVLAQLRACGVLETIKISCSGFPSRQTYPEFSERFYILESYTKWKDAPKDLTMSIVGRYLSDKDKFQFGLTKIFFRVGQVMFYLSFSLGILKNYESKD